MAFFSRRAIIVHSGFEVVVVYFAILRWIDGVDLFQSLCLKVCQKIAVCRMQDGRLFKWILAPIYDRCSYFGPTANAEKLQQPVFYNR